MTLVVAAISGEDIRLVADSLLTPAEQGASRSGGLPPMALKVIALRPDLCVAYAGRAEDALVAINALRVAPDAPLPLDGVEKSLLEAHEKGDRQTDFLVAALEPQASLSKISRGTITRHQRGFLGCVKAYDHFHRVFAENNDSSLTPAQQLGAQLESAMEQVIEDPSIESVNGFCVRLASDYGGFRYLGSTVLLDAHVEIPAGAEPGVVYPIPFAGTAQGGYRYSISAPAEPGIGALAIYMQPGNLGLLLHPKVSLYPIQVGDVTHKDFLTWVNEEYGIALEKTPELTPVEGHHPFIFRIEGTGRDGS